MKKALSLLLAVLMVISTVAISGIVSASAEDAALTADNFSAFTTETLDWTPAYDFDSSSVIYESGPKDGTYATKFTTGDGTTTNTLATNLANSIDVTGDYIGFWFYVSDTTKLANLSLDISSAGSNKNDCIRFSYNQ
ncbi:MAG: hypothetical protein ACI4QV_04665, partial [Acutalibacteraceae bacterium]